MSGKTGILAVVGSLVICSTFPVAAYVGPGAGITLIGAFIGLFSALAAAVFAVIAWPLRKFMAARRAKDEEQSETRTE